MLPTRRPAKHLEVARTAGQSLVTIFNDIPDLSKILALTAHASRQQHDPCLACGMDGVLTKPVNMAEMLQGLAAAVDQAGSLQQESPPLP